MPAAHSNNPFTHASVHSQAPFGMHSVLYDRDVASPPPPPLTPLDATAILSSATHEELVRAANAPYRQLLRTQDTFTREYLKVFRAYLREVAYRESIVRTYYRLREEIDIVLRSVVLEDYDPDEPVAEEASLPEY